MKIGAKLFPAPTQLVPETGAGMDADRVLQSLANALKGCLPNPSSKLVTTRETWLHREYRLATRNLLVALGNALVYVLPNGFKLDQCIPSNLLKPRGGCSRVKLLQQELQLLTMGRECDRSYHFLWADDADRVCRNPDFYLDPAEFYRLTFSGDEGTDVSWLERGKVFCCVQVHLNPYPMGWPVLSTNEFPIACQTLALASPEQGFPHVPAPGKPWQLDLFLA